jgi:hypothetical protein
MSYIAVGHAVVIPMKGILLVYNPVANFNGQNDVEKSFKGKDINGIGNKEETLNTNGSQDVVAFF